MRVLLTLEGNKTDSNYFQILATLPSLVFASRCVATNQSYFVNHNLEIYKGAPLSVNNQQNIRFQKFYLVIVHDKEYQT